MQDNLTQERAIKIERGGRSLKETISLLQLYKKNNENVFVEFEGQKLYSLFDTKESCERKVLSNPIENDL